MLRICVEERFAPVTLANSGCVVRLRLLSASCFYVCITVANI